MNFSTVFFFGVLQHCTRTLLLSIFSRFVSMLNYVLYTLVCIDMKLRHVNTCKKTKPWWWYSDCEYICVHRLATRIIERSNAWGSTSFIWSTFTVWTNAYRAAIRFAFSTVIQLQIHSVVNFILYLRQGDYQTTMPML